MIYLIKKLIISGKNFTYVISTFTVMLSLTLFIFGNNGEKETMLALIWICTVSVLQISTSDLFSSDYYDGVLEQIFIQPISSRFLVACKIFSHWLLFGLPISAISCIFNFIALGNDIKYSMKVGFSLLLSTLLIVNISAVGNVLMIGRDNLAYGISQILTLPIIMPIFVYFKVLAQFEGLHVNIYILPVTALVFTVLITNSIIAIHTILKSVVEYD